MRNLFSDKKELTLREIYDELLDNEEIKLSGERLRHRIRSTLYALKKNGEINRISDSKYRKCD